MRRLLVAGITSALLAQGCYSFEPWSGSTRTPHYEHEREVRVGSAVQIRAAATPESVNVVSSAIPECRHAKFGTFVEQQGRNGTPSFWAHATWFLALAGSSAGFIAIMNDAGQDNVHDAAAFVAGGIGVAFTAAMLLLYLPSLLQEHAIMTPWYLPDHDHQTRSVVGGATSIWVGDAHACGDAAGYASLPVGVLARFANTQRSILWHGTTGTGDTVSFPIVRTIQAVAHYCGPARVEVGQLVDSKQPSPTNEGTPDSPHAIVRVQEANVPVSVSGDVQVPLETIDGAWARQVATECRDARVRACVASESPRAAAGCEEGCVRSVDATRCVLGRAACFARSTGDSDRQFCASRYRKCLDEEGVEPDALGACVESCQRRVAEVSCQMP